MTLSKYTLLLFFFPFLAHAQEGSYDRQWLDLLAAERKRAQNQLEYRAPVDQAPIDVVYHRFEWEIDPAVRYIQGTVTTHFVSQMEGLNTVSFDLHADLDVEEIWYHGSPLTSYFHSPDHKLDIELPAPLAENILDSIHIRYAGVPPGNGLGSFTQRTHGPDEIPIIWTLSEPYGQRDWWPGKQDLIDKIDSIDVIVTSPQEYRTASNGVLISDEVVGDNRIMHWKHRYPITGYLVAIAVTNYLTFSQQASLPDGTSLEILNYVFPESLPQFQQNAGKVIAVMELYNELFGTYPFAEEKYGHAQFLFPGGMEHQTMSFMFNLSDLLVSHELAHQWFGDMVTCGSWQDIWLNEGFATYLEGLIYENGLGGKTFDIWLQEKIDQIVQQPGGSVWVNDTTDVGRIFSGRLSYSKGSMLLHMLRWKLGDDAFFLALRNYLNDPELTHGFARTEDLQRHLEEAGGQDLDEFFADWFFGEGYPSYTVQWSKNGSRVRMEVSQRTSHPSVDFFEMPLPIQLADQEKDTILVLDLTASGQEFEFELGFEPDSLYIDPDRWILSAGNQVTFTTPVTDPGVPVVNLRLFPNPAGERLYIDTDTEDSRFLSLGLFTIDGKQLRRMPFRREINVDDLSPGTYILHLKLDSGDINRAFVVE